MNTSDKLLAVFYLFTIDEPEWTVESAAERLQLPVSTAYRFFKSLGDAGLISIFTPGRYVLGPAIIALDRQTRLLDPLIQVARPVMHHVVGALRIPGVILLCRLFRKQVMCIHQDDFNRPSSTVSYERGRLMPLYRGAASKAILASLPMRTIRALYATDTNAMIEAGFPSSWIETKSVLRNLRNDRICITAGELDTGMTGLGVPLRNASGAVYASLGFVLPDKLATPGRLARISDALDAAAREIDGAFVREK